MAMVLQRSIADSKLQPQTDVSSKNMACNGPPNPTTPSDKIISVTAGTNVTAVWRQSLDGRPFGNLWDPLVVTRY
jgi:hypothetical protein